MKTCRMLPVSTYVASAAISFCDTRPFCDDFYSLMLENVLPTDSRQNIEFTCCLKDSYFGLYDILRIFVDLNPLWTHRYFDFADGHT